MQKRLDLLGYSVASLPQASRWHSWLLCSLGLHASHLHSRPLCSLRLCASHSHSHSVHSLRLRASHSHSQSLCSLRLCAHENFRKNKLVSIDLKCSGVSMPSVMPIGPKLWALEGDMQTVVMTSSDNTKWFHEVIFSFRQPERFSVDIRFAMLQKLDPESRHRLSIYSV